MNTTVPATTPIAQLAALERDGLDALPPEPVTGDPQR